MAIRSELQAPITAMWKLGAGWRLVPCRGFRMDSGAVVRITVVRSIGGENTYAVVRT